MLVLCQFAGWPPLPQDAANLLAKGDVQGSLAVLNASAEGGDAVAMFWLGRWLEEVQGVPHDYAQAMRWYREAADREVGVAAWSAGRLHEMGRGTSIDSEEAQRWYRKAANLGFRRTALTVIKLRWYPGPGPLAYEGVPEALRKPTPHLSPDMAFLNRPPPDLAPEELDTLRAEGLRGRLVWEGGEPGLFGLPARVILIAHKQVTKEVRLRLPLEGSTLYVQRDDDWQRFGSENLAERTARIKAETPQVTSVTVEMEDGGTQGAHAWNWPRP
jgi:hypothetical protein